MSRCLNFGSSFTQTLLIEGGMQKYGFRLRIITKFINTLITNIIIILVINVLICRLLLLLDQNPLFCAMNMPSATSPISSDNEDTIIRIDPRREVPFSRYQELKGLSQSRVSQFKAEGKLQIRFIPFLNQELVVLSPEDYQLNQLLPLARQPAPSLS